MMYKAPVSYFLQGGMVIFLALFVIYRAIGSIRRLKKHINGQVLNSSLDKFMMTFLGAQYYYGISLQAAAFHYNPNNVIL